MKVLAILVLSLVAAVSCMEIKRRATTINNHQTNFAGSQPFMMPPNANYMGYYGYGYPNGFPFMPPQQPNGPQYDPFRLDPSRPTAGHHPWPVVENDKPWPTSVEEALNNKPKPNSDFSIPYPLPTFNHNNYDS